MAIIIKKKPKAAPPFPLPATYPKWIYDGSPIEDTFGHGERAVKWLRSLKHPKNPLPGHAFQLDTWQERIVRRVYGPRHEDGTRIVRNVVLLVPRGNRKTSLGAGLALLHTFGPELIPGGECVAAACDRKQAKIAYREAYEIILSTPALEKYARLADYKNILHNTQRRSFFESISSDAGKQHGRTPAFALIDELHAWPKRDLWDAIRSGLPKTKGSLMFLATTAGRGQENLSHELIEYARKVARGEIDDPATLPILFETPPDADWQDEAVWRVANPGMTHGYPDIEGLRQLAREAANRPGDREAFKQYHLNMWMDQSAAAFVEMSDYDRGKTPINPKDLEGEPCWLGVDLSSTSDLTVIVAAWRDGDGGYIVRPWFFCPADNLHKRATKEGLPYTTWAEEGLITATPGNVVDYEYVEDKIRELCDSFDVREIAFDPALAQRSMNILQDEGYPVVAFRQGFLSMAPAVMELERAILAGKFQHGGHPVLRWNFDNIVVDMDAAGNKKFTKAKAKDKIDGAVASAMAVARAATGEDHKSVYDTDARPNGFLILA
jgi:phage terminase large subunit-like protein